MVQTEKPIHDNYNSTLRGFKKNAENNAILKKLKKAVESEEALNKLLLEVIIRFDTNPKYYLKEDFHKLLLLIGKSSNYFLLNIKDLLESNENIKDVVDKLNNLDYITDEEIDASFDELEKLVLNKYNKIL